MLRRLIPVIVLFLSIISVSMAEEVRSYKNAGKMELRLLPIGNTSIQIPNDYAYITLAEGIAHGSVISDSDWKNEDEALQAMAKSNVQLFASSDKGHKRLKVT